MGGKENGGAELFFLDCVTTLADMPDIEQQVIIQADPYRETRLAEKHIPAHRAGFSRLLKWNTRRKVRKTIRDFKPDIVQYWMVRAASYAQQGTHTNVIWHGGYKQAKLFSVCPNHIVVTNDLKRHAVECGAQPANVDVVHTTVSFGTDLSPVPRRELNTPEHAVVLLSLARLHPVKGLDTLLRAMVDLPSNYIAWLAGDGPMEQELKSLATELGIADRVRFLGWRNDRERLLAACDVVVFPTRGDSFGTIMVDGWAMHKPVVATDAPGPKAYLQNEVNGMLVSRDDAPAFANAIRRVVEDKALHDTLILNGWDTYQKSFSKDALMRDSMRVYKKLAEKK